MAHEHLKNSTLPRVLSEVVADLADLVQKELRLARAELSANISTKLKAGMWISAAAICGLIATFLLAQAVVFWIASFGIAMQWSCLIVAVVLAAAGALAYQKSRADARKELTPTRALHQIKQDIATSKEQLT